MDLTLLSSFNRERSARRAAILVTNMGTGQQRLVRSDDDLANDPLAADLGARFRSGKSGLVELTDGTSAFLTVAVPSPRLVVIGAVHISQALVPMAEATGFDVTVIDPRTAFATEDRFPNGTLRAEWPQDVLRDIPLDAYTAVAAVTHDPKIDDMPLLEALNAGCFYVGALGSRKTHGNRVDRFLAAGLSAEQIARIDAPIGLDIGASSPAEIAVSVLAAIVKALRHSPERVSGGR